MVLAKINKFLYVFMLGKTGKEKEFRNFLDRKLAFLDYKNMHEKKKCRKRGHFPKGLLNGFGQNYEISLFLLFR